MRKFLAEVRRRRVLRVAGLSALLVVFAFIGYRLFTEIADMSTQRHASASFTEAPENSLSRI